MCNESECGYFEKSFYENEMASKKPLFGIRAAISLLFLSYISSMHSLHIHQGVNELFIQILRILFYFEYNMQVLIISKLCFATVT